MEMVMTKISKLTVAAALVAAVIASPAFAQSFNPGDGGMNSLPLQYQADGGRNAWTAPQSDVQVAVRKGASVQVASRPRSGSGQVAARHNNAIKIAGHRTAQHGA
jgi:hypothetical protein